MPEETPDRLEQANRNLYSRQAKPSNSSRARFSEDHNEQTESWQAPTNQPMRKKLKIPPLYLGLTIAAIFFVLSAVVAFVSFSTGHNVISSENIEIDVKGPVSIKGGEKLTLQLLITNNNSVPLESADLALIFPQGSRDPEDLEKELSRYPRFIGTLKPGETIRETISAVLFGDENETKKIDVLLEYRTQGSNAIFEKRETYNVVITSAPIHVSLSVPNEGTVGQEIPIEVTITSNSTSPLQGMHLELDYPDGFQFKSAVPKPTVGTNLWNLGEIPPSGSKTITLRGVIGGSENEVQGITAVVGLRKGDERVVGVPYSTAFETLEVQKPFLALTLSIEGNTTGRVNIDPGRKVRADLSWQNNLPDGLRDGELTIEIRGTGLNPESVNVQDGFFRSSDNVIVWRPQDVALLRELPSRASGHVSFEFAILGSAALTSKGVVNPELVLTARYSGERVSEGFAGERVNSTQAGTVRVNSRMAVASRAVRTAGPFSNTGPLPPRANQETTYTILWAITNTSNDLRDVTLEATLPSYVKWLGVVSPAGEVTYAPTSGRVTWSAGNVAAGTGSKTGAREVAFQVSLTPSISQVGERPELLGELFGSGRDTFTGVTLESGDASVSTEILTDPNYSDSQTRVQN